jgi:hypothetical protein
MISFVLVTLADPTAPDGTVALVKLPAILQHAYEDKSADLTVFSNASFVPSRGPVFFLEKVPLDNTRTKAPSYALDEKEKALVSTTVKAAPTPAGPEQRRVFGKGASSHMSNRSTAPRRFESAAVAAAKGTASPEQLLRQVGSPKASLPGQKPPRVFVKGRGEVTSREHTDEINAEADPMGAIEAFLGSPDGDVAVMDGGEVPAPAPALGPAPHANGKDRSRAGQPL